MAKKDRDDLEYEMIYQELKHMGIPVLTLDKGWHDVFYEGKTKEIEKLERELNNAVKNRGKVTTEKAELKKLKHTLMKQIMENMDAEEESIESKKVEKSRQLIEEINDKLILMEDQELDIPDEIEEANTRLLMEGLDELCRKSMANREEIEELERLIEESRIELKKKILLREQKIEDNERIDKYLRKTVGRDIIRRYEQYLK